jgi:signal transduction histidine kinase
LNYEIPNFNLNISFKLENNLPLIMVNKIHIMQVILNLARNSIEALQHAAIAKPKLMIHTSALENVVVVDVIDNGPGIPFEYMDKILTSHFTTKPLGTGLGLAICLNILEAHGGSLVVERKRKNGACFTFKLPYNKA